MAEYINGIKVPETVEELNALGVYAKAAHEDIEQTLDNIRKSRGEHTEFEFWDLCCDYGHCSADKAYQKGFEMLLKREVTEAVNRVLDQITIGRARGMGLDMLVESTLEKIGKNEGTRFRWHEPPTTEEGKTAEGKDGADDDETKWEPISEIFDADWQG